MADRSYNLILTKAEAFALRIIETFRTLQERGEYVMSKQLLRSGTSIGANVTEGHYAASRADFVNKYVIAQKEAAETLYWLNLLTKAGYLSDDTVTKSVVSNCDELLRMLVASIKTAKANTTTPHSSLKLPH